MGPHGITEDAAMLWLQGRDNREAYVLGDISSVLTRLAQLKAAQWTNTDNFLLSPKPPLLPQRHIWHSGLKQEVHSASLDNIAGVRITKWRKHQAGAGRAELL